MIIDSHCHLNYEPMSLSLDNYIERANKADIKYMLTISTEDKHYSNIIKIIDKYKCVYGTYGIHPHEAKLHKEIKKDVILDKIKKNNKIIGIGETGLDFYYKHSDKNDQIFSFKEHIKASQDSGLPLIVHTRSAEDETFDILKNSLKEKDFKILIHCFTGTKNFAIKLLDLGAYISASGIVTFKKSKELADTIKYIPNDRLLVETDSPYLAPEPMRGKSNEPSYLIHTVKFLSNLKNVSFDELSNKTSSNFFNLFGDISEK